MSYTSTIDAACTPPPRSQGEDMRLCSFIGGGANSEHEKIPHIVFSRHYAEGVPERKTICGIFLSLSYTSSIIAKGAASPLRRPVLITRV